jgi:hypothetical protein
LACSEERQPTVSITTFEQRRVRVQRGMDYCDTFGPVRGALRVRQQTRGNFLFEISTRHASASQSLSFQGFLRRAEIEAHVTAMGEYEDGAAFTTIASDALTVTPNGNLERRMNRNCP